MDSNQPRIHTRCPACHNDTLIVNNGRLLCTWIDCKDPTSINRLGEVTKYVHPKTIDQFEEVYRKEYQQELASCDHWIRWCREQCDTHGINFYQGMRSAHVFNNIKMEQLLRVLKREEPNV